MKDFIVSSKQGVHERSSNWEAVVAFNIIGWCWESYHKLNFCSFCIGDHQARGGLVTWSASLLGEQSGDTDLVGD